MQQTAPEQMAMRPIAMQRMVMEPVAREVIRTLDEATQKQKDSAGQQSWIGMSPEERHVPLSDEEQ
jgi:hypothetical protein